MIFPNSTSSMVLILVLLATSLTQFSFGISWSSRSNFLTHCSHPSYISLKLVIAVTFQLSALQIRLTIRSSFGIAHIVHPHIYQLAFRSVSLS